MSVGTENVLMFECKNRFKKNFKIVKTNCKKQLRSEKKVPTQKKKKQYNIILVVYYSMPLDFIFLILYIIGSWLGTSKYFDGLNLSIVLPNI